MLVGQDELAIIKFNPGPKWVIDQQEAMSLFSGNSLPNSIEVLLYLYRCIY